MANPLYDASYRVGTATPSFGSKVVTFQNAGAIEQAFNRGDYFYADTGSPIAIESVDSATQVTLYFPWRGTTTGPVAYEVRKQFGAMLSIPERQRQLVEAMEQGVIPDLAEIDPVANTLVGFGGTGTAALLDRSGARNMLGLVPQTSPSDATAGRLLTPGAFGLGKTLQLSNPNLLQTRPSGLYYCNNPTNGVENNINGWLEVYDLDIDYAFHQFTSVTTGKQYTNLRYNGSWLGWKLQTGEVGVNPAGRYLKRDGVIFCWNNVTISVGASTLFTDSFNLGWPTPFSSLPVAQATAISNYGNAVGSAQVVSLGSVTYQARAFNQFNSANNAGTCTVSVFAIGV